MDDINNRTDAAEEPRYSSRSIKTLDESDRPREKALTHGIDVLNNSELMAIIFGSGVRGMNVVDLCKMILRDNDDSLSMVAKLSVDEICAQYKGIGPVKAITLLAALKLGQRAQLDADRRAGLDPVREPAVAYRMMKDKLQWLQHEEFWVMYISRSGKPIKTIKISQGGTVATTVDIKIILRNALKYSADSMILFHNHPSGTLMSSREDDNLTQRIAIAAKTLDIKVNDHIIITDSGFYSYADHGKL